MWNEVETTQVLLKFKAIVDTAAQIIKEGSSEPVSIGVSSSHGVEKVGVHVKNEDVFVIVTVQPAERWNANTNRVGRCPDCGGGGMENDRDCFELSFYGFSHEKLILNLENCGLWFVFQPPRTFTISFPPYQSRLVINS